MKTKTLILIFFTALGIMWLGFFGLILAVVTSILFLRGFKKIIKFSEKPVKFIWKALTYRGRLLDNPLNFEIKLPGFKKK